jgi:hypothetical protein
MNPVVAGSLTRTGSTKEEPKYGDDWAFEVAGDGTFSGSLVYQLIPVQALGFGKDPFSHTRWDFTA